MQIRFAKRADIERVVEIHSERFSNFFLSSLGKAFLNVYYSAFLAPPGLLIVLEDEQKIKGFACGSYSNSSFYKKLLIKNIKGFVRIGLILLFTKPKSLLRIVKNLASAGAEEREFGELLSIATERNNKGYGRALLKAFEQEIVKANQDGFVNVSLTTDYDNNDGAVRFYKENGYEVLSVFQGYEKRRMYRFIKKLER